MLRRIHVDAFHRTQDRHGRRDHRVAKEDRRAKQAHPHEHAFEPGLGLDRLRGQRQHRDEAPFAVVVRPQDEHDVLERDHDGHRPEQQREHPQDVVGCQGNVSAVEHFLEGVERAGADVAVDDAQGAEGHDG
jgi:hypothetical protein